MKVITKKLGY
ncbi:hypothetical protein VCHC41B1_3518A, partial [Vibrio cholerae HC-41B1]